MNPVPRPRMPALRRRNTSLFDAWSVVHTATGIVFGWLVHPVLAWIVMAAWEPLEIFVIHRIVHRLTGKHFGYESWRNSLSDIAFNTLGIALGLWVMRPLVTPPLLLP